MDAITSSTIPLTPSSTATSAASASTYTTPPSQTNSAQSTLSKVAAAVVGVTGVGKRRPSVVGELEAGIVGGGTFAVSKFRAKTPPVPVSTAMQQQHQLQHCNNYYYGSGNEGIGGSGTAAGLDAEQLQNHVRFMRSEKSMAELTEYVDMMYHTIMNKGVALEYSRTQISALHKELDQNRVQGEEDRKALTAEVDTVKEQVVKMEENFLLWRTKVHSDQMTHQEEFLQERLVKQDRIEELEDMLHNSQEEVTRLRNRLLVLEYEDGYVGPTVFLPDSHQLTLTTTTSPTSSSPGDHPANPSTTIAIEHKSMTINAHMRRSGDFKVMEQRAQGFESQVQELKRMIEKQRMGHCQDLADLRAKLGARCTKLENDVHAAKMESTMYNEMMHEVVTENDDLRQQVKELRRKLHRQGLGQGQSGDIACSSISNSSRPRRNRDYYGLLDNGSYSLDGSDDDDIENVVI
ncbi:hypothetical protein BGW39_005917 [Mortierella sp. 14UC]|nr:hypothetical protein BGW39_005917 [Mortierella sp. 14UC]